MTLSFRLVLFPRSKEGEFPNLHPLPLKVYESYGEDTMDRNNAFVLQHKSLLMSENGLDYELVRQLKSSDVPSAPPPYWPKIDTYLSIRETEFSSKGKFPSPLLYFCLWMKKTKNKKHCRLYFDHRYSSLPFVGDYNNSPHQ